MVARQFWNYVLGPFVEATAAFWHERLHLQPNHITGLSATCGVVAAAALYGDYTTVSAALYILGYYFDCLDGIVARRYKLCSDTGAQMDVVTDFVTNALHLHILFGRDLSLPVRLLLTAACVGNIIINAGRIKEISQQERPVLNCSYKFITGVLNEFAKSIVKTVDISAWFSLDFYAIIVAAITLYS